MTVRHTTTDSMTLCVTIVSQQPPWRPLQGDSLDDSESEFQVLLFALN